MSPEEAAESARHTLHLRHVQELFMQQDRPVLTVPAPLYSCLYVVVRQLAIWHHLGEEQ